MHSTNQLVEIPPHRIKSEQGIFNGDRFSQKSFHKLYMKTSEQFKAELIGGTVFLSSPVYAPHARPHQRIAAWLGAYMTRTPGIDAFDNITNVLGNKSEPQPDLVLVRLPETGGKATLDADGVLHGPAELVIEIAFTSYSIDLHKKKIDYEKAGVQEYLVVLSEHKTVRAFQRQNEELIETAIDSSGIWKSKMFPGLWLNVPGIFKRSIDPLMDTVTTGKRTMAYRKFARQLRETMAKYAKEE